VSVDGVCVHRHDRGRCNGSLARAPALPLLSRQEQRPEGARAYGGGRTREKEREDEGGGGRRREGGGYDNLRSDDTREGE
jgi:hypothetical protein